MWNTLNPYLWYNKVKQHQQTRRLQTMEWSQTFNIYRKRFADKEDCDNILGMKYTL